MVVFNITVLLQDDILSDTLTVKESVHLSASLRLPRDMDHREREEKVDEVIEELGLSHVANTLVLISVATYLIVNDYSFTVTDLDWYSA